MATRQDEGMLPDNYPSVEDEPLSQIELDAKAYWERFLPALTQQLKAESPDAMDTAIRAAWWRREYGIRVTLARNPHLHRDQVNELFQTELYPPPESPETPVSDPLITN